MNLGKQQQPKLASYSPSCLVDAKKGALQNLGAPEFGGIREAVFSGCSILQLGR